MSNKSKEIKHELAVVRSADSTVFSLYRIPNAPKNYKPIEVNMKPKSKYTEIKSNFPNKNTSALKLKNLNASCISYKSYPSGTKNFYYSKIEGNKVVLYKIQNAYVFQPTHDYYPFEYESKKTNMAENREEYEHRMKSINYKLKLIENEEFVKKKFVDATILNKTVSKEDETEQSNIKTVNNEIEKKDDVVESENTTKKPIVKIDSEYIKRIEKTIFNARICNMKEIVKMFKDEKVTKNIMYRMTENVYGRYVIKNSFYEKCLHEHRTKMLEMFRESEVIPAKELAFLDKEIWMAHEIADLRGIKFYLKGYRGPIDHDPNHLKDAKLNMIDDLMKKHRLMSIPKIVESTGLLEDEIVELLHNNPDYFHLSNNSYALNDETYWINDAFRLLRNKKSFAFIEMEERLREQLLSFENSDLAKELEKYFVPKGNKYFLK